jgi:hypothetical protein
MPRPIIQASANMKIQASAKHITNSARIKCLAELVERAKSQLFVDSSDAFWVECRTA